MMIENQNSRSKRVEINSTQYDANPPRKHFMIRIPIRTSTQCQLILCVASEREDKPQPEGLVDWVVGKVLTKLQDESPPGFAATRSPRPAGSLSQLAVTPHRASSERASTVQERPVAMTLSRHEVVTQV